KTSEHYPGANQQNDGKSDFSDDQPTRRPIRGPADDAWAIILQNLIELDFGPDQRRNQAAQNSSQNRYAESKQKRRLIDPHLGPAGNKHREVLRHAPYRLDPEIGQQQCEQSTET